ncbi:hypothetical protein T484DRAFT_1811494 [Baffinella frigidus]|nr:hypothetical protein T484DRAFT_1811494 [Cryptophyta sp. CCMP2293]
MKYLECAQITELDVVLQSGIDVGDTSVQGKLEIYSCKLAPGEKKLASSLDKQLANEFSIAMEPAEAAGYSISPASASPLGSVNEIGVSSACAS